MKRRKSRIRIQRTLGPAIPVAISVELLEFKFNSMPKSYNWAFKRSMELMLRQKEEVYGWTVKGSKRRTLVRFKDRYYRLTEKFKSEVK